jgi:hypothetical protein
MTELNRREFVHRGAAVGGAAALALSPWAATVARAAGAAAPGMNARRRATCTALAEVVADYPGADRNVRGAVDSLVAHYDGAPSAHQTTLLRVIDAVEGCTENGSFSAASKKQRADALRKHSDELLAGPLRPGSPALLVDAGLANVSRYMVYEQRSTTPKPIPSY